MTPLTYQGKCSDPASNARGDVLDLDTWAAIAGRMDDAESR
jgi:hypothetical protein